MRVAFVTVGDTSRRTGGYLYHARLFAGLRQRGVDVREYVASPDASPAGQRQADPRLAAWNAGIVAADVVVVDALARIACAGWVDGWRAARPLVTLVHELPSVAGTGADASDDRAAEARLLRADVLIAVSGHGRSILIERGVDARRIVVASPGSDRLGGDPAPPDRRDRKRAVCVAQWIPRKGIDTLVEAWNRLENTDASLELIGETDADPAYATAVRSMIAAGRGDVIVSGVVDDERLEHAYATAGVFVLPSRYEGYGMVYAEALLHGLPVVACTVGPVPEVVGSEAGLLVPPDDPAALAAALAALFGDGKMWELMAQAAVRRGRELPTWDETVSAVYVALATAMSRRQ